MWLTFCSPMNACILTIRVQYLVYNARKRGEDRASDYFKRTENIAGVKDMRFQALMPDILHWLGITKIDRMLSMSKYVYTYSKGSTITRFIYLIPQKQGVLTAGPLTA